MNDEASTRYGRHCREGGVTREPVATTGGVVTPDKQCAPVRGPVLAANQIAAIALLCAGCTVSGDEGIIDRHERGVAQHELEGLDRLEEAFVSVQTDGLRPNPESLDDCSVVPEDCEGQGHRCWSYVDGMHTQPVGTAIRCTALDATAPPAWCDFATPGCEVDGCVRDLVTRYDFGESVELGSIRAKFGTGWRRPRSYELWASDDPQFVPGSGATLVATQLAAEGPWTCVQGDSCDSPYVPERCCANGPTQDLAGVGFGHPKWDEMVFAATSARYWFVVIKDAQDPNELFIWELGFREPGCDMGTPPELSPRCVPSQPIVTTPADLSAGAPYRLAFVSCHTRDAVSTDIAEYNAFVQDHAGRYPTLAALATQWRVIGSTATVDARANLGYADDDIPIYGLDGIRIADDYVDLFDGELQSPLSVSPAGNAFEAPTMAFTGSQPWGTADPLTLGEDDVTFGIVGRSDTSWMRAANDAATNYNHVYAVSGTLTAAASPDIVPRPRAPRTSSSVETASHRGVPGQHGHDMKEAQP